MYVAVYVTFHWTAHVAGVHHANVYVYCAVAVFVGVAQLYSGVSQYGTFVSVSNVVQLSFFHVTVYVFTVLLYVALYVKSHVTNANVGFHHANVYVYWAVAAFDGFVCDGIVL